MQDEDSDCEEERQDDGIEREVSDEVIPGRDMADAGLRPVSAGDRRAGDVGTGQCRLKYHGARQVGLAEIRIFEASLSEFGLPQVCPAKRDAVQIADLVENGMRRMHTGKIGPGPALAAQSTLPLTAAVTGEAVMMPRRRNTPTRPERRWRMTVVFKTVP